MALRGLDLELRYPSTGLNRRIEMPIGWQAGYLDETSEADGWARRNLKDMAEKYLKIVVLCRKTHGIA